MADKNGSSTAWATVLYPDSMPFDVWDVLEHFCVPIAVSPLHDSDIKSDGSLDKPHYHVLFTFGKSKKSPSQFDEMRSLIGGVGKECVMSAKGYARYLCHLDSPSKHQYNISDVRCFGGFDYDSVIETSGSITQTLGHIIKWCNINGVFVYSDLVDYCLSENYEWFTVLSRQSGIVRDYMKSKAWSLSRSRQNCENGQE